jgi:hypothetical protein
VIDEANSRVIAKVRVALADGTEEIWMVPMRRTKNGPHYHEWIYLPEGATVIERSHELRPLSSGQEIRIDQRELFTEPTPTLPIRPQ